jgi:hypothetical protein
LDNNGISGYHALLFTAICYSNDCALLKKLKPSERPVYDLRWVEDAPSCSFAKFMKEEEMAA